MYKLIVTAIMAIVTTTASAKEYLPDSDTWYHDNWNYVHVEDLCIEDSPLLGCLNPDVKIYVIEHVDNHYSLFIHGTITHGLAPKVDEMITDLKAANEANGYNYAFRVNLSSNGGYVTGGIELGKVFRKHYVETNVSGESVCASSCAIAWLGGFHRTHTNESKVVFHAPYMKSKYGGKACLKETSTLGQMLVEYFEDHIPANKIGKLKKDSFKCNPNGGVTYKPISNPYST